MQRCMLLSKIFHARVTEANQDYDGSIAIPADIMEHSGILPGERVLVANVTNGARFETYAITGTKERHYCLNGATAHLGSIGDSLIIFTFAWMDNEECKTHKPKAIYMNADNTVDRIGSPGSGDGPSEQI